MFMQTSLASFQRNQYSGNRANNRLMATTDMQRLKDTCDMCSISKVRCDKSKPVCGGCKRLEYTCNYHPACRISKCARPRSVENSQKFLNKGVAVLPSTSFIASSISSSSSISSQPASSHSTFETNAESVSLQLMPQGILFHSVKEHVLPYARQADFVFWLLRHIDEYEHYSRCKFHATDLRSRSCATCKWIIHLATWSAIFTRFFKGHQWILLLQWR